MIVRVLTEPEIRELIDADEARECVRSAFSALDRGAASLPRVLHLALPEHEGEAHAKGAWLRGDRSWTIKVATGFYANSRLGLPVTGGVNLVFSASTGILETILLDNGYLTELRTAAAGALAADLAASPAIGRVAIIGAGGQARYQLEALLRVRSPGTVTVFARRTEAAEAFAGEMHGRHGIEIEVARSVKAAVESADLIVTVTPSRVPLVEADWLKRGTHITAVGADTPDKQELASEVLARATHVIVDDADQCATQGEARHALAVGALDGADLIPLGALACGRIQLDRAADDITVADLTGVGVQDAAVSALVAERAVAREIGAPFEQ
jgi:ornithine cyclodeaminase